MMNQAMNESDTRLAVRKAHEAEIADVVRLYQSAVGRSGCTWNAFYPTLEEARSDYDHGGLYVALLDGRIIGAASVVPENELDDLPCWKAARGGREIARVVVSAEYAGRGFGAAIVGQLLAALKDGGCGAVHLLVAQSNPAAIATYRRLGFAFLGECFLYDNHYYACELMME